MGRWAHRESGRESHSETATQRSKDRTNTNERVLFTKDPKVDPGRADEDDDDVAEENVSEGHGQ